MNRNTSGPAANNITLERKLFFLLGCLALIYAFLAGLRTISDFDTGWQMATGRWVIQHHRVPSFDVLSYTAQGEHWLYPVWAGVIFYLFFQLGGFAILSWISALACAGTIALLLRRGSAVGAAIAIFAVPLIAERTPPRADMFSVLLFAAFLSLLWQQHRSGDARLWLLPPLMVLWVNVHFGFVAGLGLIGAYVGVEMLELVSGEQRRRAAWQRLRAAYPWLLLTAAATLLNSWGWRMYQGLLVQQHANSEQQTWIAEWKGVRVNWPTVNAAFSSGGVRAALFVLLAVAIVAGIIALVRREWGAAVLLLASTYPPVRHIRMGAVFACVVVVVGGPVLSAALARGAEWLRPARLRTAVAIIATIALAFVVYSRSADLVSNRFYFGSTPQLSTFGTGLSWWFPERAVQFVEQEKLPGEIFNTYDEGGYLTLTLGPGRLDYIDGRDTLFGLKRIQHNRDLLQSPPDSVLWQEEIDRYHINTIILSRSDGIQHGHLRDLCSSTIWRPVYLDNVSAVFVRRTPESEQLIQRFPVDCATAPLPARNESTSRTQQFIASFNAGAVLVVLGREDEALQQSEKAIALFPGSVDAHLLRASALSSAGRKSEAEQELLTSIGLSPTEYTWSALAQFYIKENRTSEAIAAIQKAADLETDPALTYIKLGQYALATGHPDDALNAFAKALHTASGDEERATGDSSIRYQAASGQAEAWDHMGDPKQAANFQEEAVQAAPDLPQAWLTLAKLYQSQGRSADAGRAKAHAVAILSGQSQ